MSDLFGNKFLDEIGHYKEHSKEETEKEVNKILGMWQNFLIAQGEKNCKLNRDYYVHKRNLFEVIKRLDKRKTYYYVFHEIDDICEYKEIGILAYWINTLKPFMVVNESCKVYNCPNEMFSLYIIISVLAQIYNCRYPDKEFVVPEPMTIQDYVYNFKYCDLSREAMIFFVETLAKSYGIGMDTNAVVDKRQTLNKK